MQCPPVLLFAFFLSAEETRGVDSGCVCVCVHVLVHVSVHTSACKCVLVMVGCNKK